MVVVGSTLDEQYPETAEVWKGRLAYSVYLKVGLEKSWILQYSLPRAADSANAGSAHLDAPWPYYIVRPNLNPDDATSDSVMVHGFVNEAGHFEKLSVVFPTDMGYAREQLVLNASAAVAIQSRQPRWAGCQAGSSADHPGDHAIITGLTSAAQPAYGLRCRPGMSFRACSR